MEAYLPVLEVVRNVLALIGLAYLLITFSDQSTVVWVVLGVFTLVLAVLSLILSEWLFAGLFGLGFLVVFATIAIFAYRARRR